MFTIIHQRAKCIGCNYCVEVAPDRWRMSQNDGKSNLLGSTAKKGFYSVKVHDIEKEANQKAASLCPVNIITLHQ